MLWAGLWFERLALECFPRTGDQPLAIIEEVLGKPRLHACNGAARRSGVVPGMALDAALSLCQDLQSRLRDRAAEAAALEGLADWAFAYTSTISLRPPEGLLLEVGGSLRLFGGLEPLLTRLRRDLGRLGYHATVAVAPTPLAAWWLARCGVEAVITRRAELATRLGELPAGLLSTEAGVREALAGLGLARIGDVMRIPRGGMARRLGPAIWADLDRALGRSPDPQPPYRPAERFHRHVVLPAPVQDSGQLIFAGRRLLAELAGFLQGRGMGARALEFELEHASGPITAFSLELMQPGRDPERLLALLRERLERVEPRAQVQGMGLRVERLEVLTALDGELFDSRPRDDGGAGLVERLRARLGEDAVTGLATVADHRPERAWRTVQPGAKSVPGPSLPRPAWLLPEPETLAVQEAMPCYQGRLTLVAGPERIEAGWWEGAPVLRDYYVAETADHRRLWIYRELRDPDRWFLHGLFG